MNLILLAVTALTTTLVPIRAYDSSQSKLEKVVIQLTHDSIFDESKIIEILNFSNSVFFVSDDGYFDSILFDKFGVVDYDMNIASIYYFRNQNHQLVQGTILTDSFDNILIDKKIDSITKDINENLMYNDFSEPTPLQAFTLSQQLTEGFYLGYSWNLIGVVSKVDWIVSSGEFSEWRSIYQLSSRIGGAVYYAFTFESYIKPLSTDVNYRSQSLEYNFNPNIGNPVQLRNYAPKAKTPSANISYEISSGFVVGDDGTNLNSSVSTSYSTLIESPNIIDNGSMANNLTNLRFNYVNYNQNTLPFKDYNRGQSNQNVAIIIRDMYPDNQNDIVINDIRIIKFYKGWQFLGIGNRTFTNTLTSTVTIVK
jgi:hypothetical protein